MIAVDSMLHTVENTALKLRECSCVSNRSHYHQTNNSIHSLAHSLLPFPNHGTVTCFLTPQAYHNLFLPSFQSRSHSLYRQLPDHYQLAHIPSLTPSSLLGTALCVQRRSQTDDRCELWVWAIVVVVDGVGVQAHACPARPSRLCLCLCGVCVYSMSVMSVSELHYYPTFYSLPVCARP